MSPTVTATVLFTDLVDSTALLAHVGADEAEAIRREHFEILRDAARGRAGREVKNLGDGLMLVFDGVVAALECAVAMQQGIEARNRLDQTSVPLAIRIGLSVGECDTAEDDYFGPPVVEAARLCASAAPGQILVAQLVQALAGNRGGIEMVPLGTRALKGFDEPIMTFEVAWQPIAAPLELALPARLDSAMPFGFVGRSGEQDRLHHLWKDVNAGQRQAALVSGEPGVGKTTLSSEFARLAHREGGLVLYGRCDEELGIPYQPWVELFGYLEEHCEAELRAAAGERAGELAALVPKLRATAPAQFTDPESERLAFFAAVAASLRALGETRPVLVVLDDLHWADQPTLSLVRHLITTSQAGRLMIVGTFRDSEVDERHPLADLLATFHRHEAVHRIALDGLGDEDVIALLRSAAGHDLPEEGVELAHALRRETNGNPFFAIEILRHLAETGVISRDDAGYWVGATGLLDRGLPVSVREVVGQRVARLGDETTRVLRAASVIGREFDLELLATVVELGAETVLDRLEDALVADLVTEVTPGRFSFVHALVEHTLYEGISSTRRALLHRRVAEAIEELGADQRLAELAHHWSEATSPQDAGKAIDYARRAGDHALGALAPDEASRWYARALEMADAGGSEPRLRCELLVLGGEAMRQAGDPSYRDVLFEAARAATRLGDTALLVRSALANARHSFSSFGAVDEERLALLRHALDALGDADPALRSLLLSRVATELTYGADPEDRRALADEALALAHAAGDDRTLLAVLLARGDTISAPESIDERREVGTTALALAQRHQDTVSAFLAYEILFDAAWAADDPSSAHVMLEQLTELSHRFDQPELRWPARWREAESAIVTDDLDAADRAVESALAIGAESGQPDALIFYMAQVSVVRFMQGRLGELIDAMEEITATTRPVPIQDAMLAWGRVAAGRPADAAAVLASRHEALSSVPRDEQWTFTMATWARVATSVGDSTAASVLFELLSPWAHLRAHNGASTGGPMSLYLGALASMLRHPDAESFLARAIAAADGAGDTFHAVEARLLLCRHLAPVAPDRTTELLAEAGRLAANRGFGGLDAELRALRR